MLSKQKQLEKLFNTPRMSHAPIENLNSTIGLYMMAQEIFKPDFEIAEIGSFEGTSTLLFAMYVKKVYSIDSYDYPVPSTGRIPSHDRLFVKAEKKFLKRTKDIPNIVKIKKHSVEAAKDFQNESLDAVYIDAEHDEASVRADIDAWLPKIKKGSYLCGHDAWLPFLRGILSEKGFEEAKIYPDFSWSVLKT